jgi:hypothetical protein
MARQARFGGILDHGHEAAVYRNENKPLAIIRQLTFVAEYHPKQYQAYNFGVWDVLSMIQPLSGNVTVCNITRRQQQDRQHQITISGFGTHPTKTRGVFQQQPTTSAFWCVGRNSSFPYAYNAYTSGQYPSLHL